MATKTKVSLKLLIDKKTNKVLFAEAGKDFVDFLFTILSFPLGTPSQSKDTVLNPKVQQFSIMQQSGLLLTDSSNAPSVPRMYYKCSRCCIHVTDTPQTNCPLCKIHMTTEVTYVAPGAAAAGNNGGGHQKNDDGFVKGVVTYMVMDNLEVKPMSTISSITLLNKFNIQQVGSLEEKVVELGMDQGLNLLKASLQSKTVLTNVFLGV
ncbi:hypothetical protein LINGRAHAP2_LOCUS19446 [Linum grandiflorum]